MKGRIEKGEEMMVRLRHAARTSRLLCALIGVSRRVSYERHKGTTAEVFQYLPERARGSPLRKICLTVIIVVGVCFSAGAQWLTAPDGGVAPDGTVNYVFSAGFPFQATGPLYPMPQPYWIPPVTDPAAILGKIDSITTVPMSPKKRE